MLKRLNLILIGILASSIETSMCVWAFLALPLIPLIWPALLTVVMFISSSVLQLVALPVLAVSSARQGEETRRQAAEQHDLVMSVLTEMKELHAEVHQILLSWKTENQDKPLADL